MGQFSTIFRIALALSSLATSVVLVAATVGLVPDRDSAVIEGRVALVESLAIQCSLLAGHNDIKGMKQGIQAIASRNPDLLFVTVNRKNGLQLVRAGKQSDGSNSRDDGDKPSPARMSIPIKANGKPWGYIVAKFSPVREPGWMGFVMDPILCLVAFVASLGFFATYFYLHRVLRQLDPSHAVPERVRETLDTIAEGLLILDRDERIVMANESFMRTIGLNSKGLIGQKVSDFSWNLANSATEHDLLPWVTALQQGIRQTGQMIELSAEGAERRTFLVNCSPINGSDGKCRGVLASFDDITPLEKKKEELSKMLEMLQLSSEEIKRQNEELERLSKHDVLTGCFNRRAFYTQFEDQWKAAIRYERPLSCVMLDIDYFKSINDNHGHSVGDVVLKGVAEALQAGVRNCDLVCRYGGEEFCILLPETDISKATELAERLRIIVQELRIRKLAVTVSLGISSLDAGPRTPQELLDQADKSLFIAKRSGRNRVVCYDSTVHLADIDESKLPRNAPSMQDSESFVGIPFHAVTALISALSYRDHATAEHSRRVADLCVEVSGELLSKSDCYILEIAALLHDIGKIGVPDSILLKPGPLTSEEWLVMQTHDRIGVEIIAASFRNAELSAIIHNHHAFFGGSARDPGLPGGMDIPLGARILTICDAYDAIVSDRVYRRGRSREEAFAELRQSAGRQFDPELVERFINVIGSRPVLPRSSLPAVSRETALVIGMEIERLATALDGNDLKGLQVLAGRLAAVARKDGVESVAERAANLHGCISEDAELMKILESAHELLDLCRATQKSYIEHSDEFRRSVSV